MKKRIIIGSLLAVILFVLLPAIPAMEFNVIVEENKSYIYEKIKSIDIKDLREKTKGGVGLLELFITFLLFLYIQLAVIFNRSFTLILLLADILNEIGIRLGLIEPPYFCTYIISRKDD